MSSVVLDDACTSDLFPPLTPVGSKGFPSPAMMVTIPSLPLPVPLAIVPVNAWLRPH